MRGAVWMIGLLTWIGVAARAGAATPERVDAAIGRAIAYLYSQQNQDGHWELPPEPDEPPSNQYGGWTAIAVYGLLAGGENPQDPRLLKGIEFLLNTEIKGIYALGLRANVWPLLPQTNSVKRAAERDAASLLTSADKFGRYGYTTQRGGEHNSPTQYGQLGMWAATQVGINVPIGYWQAVDNGWRQCQGDDGGWMYQSLPPGPDEATITMTCAGVASLFIAQDFLRRNQGTNPSGNIVDPDIERGIAWIADHFDLLEDNLYGWYGVERIGVASGYKYFGDIDWHQRAVETLLSAQGGDGSWATHGPIPGTAWGIIVLSRGRAPVVMNKLQYDLADKPGRAPSKIAHWNQRPRDIANLTSWIGEQIERPLNWQIVSLGIASMEDLHDAPILFMSGDQPPVLAEPDMEKIREFIEGGGILLGHSDGGRLDFARGFRALGKTMFPDYEFRRIGQDHPIFNSPILTGTKIGSRSDLEGLSNGARELMMLLPSSDPGKAWQINSRVIDAPFQIGGGIFLYAVDHQDLRYKGQTYLIPRDNAVIADREIKLARLNYGRGWDPEPGGWRRLANHLHNTRRIGLLATEVKLGAGELKYEAFEFAHLTGAGEVKLDDAQRDEIRAFVVAGGTLIIDAAGGSMEFAASMRDEIAAMFPDWAGQLSHPLPAEHDLFTAGEFPIEKIQYRRFARKRLADEELNVPRLAALEIDQRLAVYFSEEDLSVGLVGQAVDGIYGYAPEVALPMMCNILLRRP